MDIGSLLHEARVRRGLTLEAISQSTKVPVTALDHIEHNRFDRLPGTIFTKGYLRAFARSVDLDGEPLVQEYNLQSAPPPVPSRQARSAAPRQDHRTGWAFTALIASAAVAYFVVTSGRWLTSPPASASSAPAPAEMPSPVGTSGGAAAAPAPAPAAPAERSVTWPLQIEMAVTGNCWVSATVDGQSAVYRLVKSGERITVTANNEVVLRVGDPTVFAYRLDGVPGRPFGKPGAPATVRINRETYRGLL